MAKNENRKAVLRQQIADRSQMYIDANRELLEAIARYHEVDPRGEVTAAALVTVEKCGQMMEELQQLVLALFVEEMEYDA